VKKAKIVFIYDHSFPEIWRDGLWEALNILRKKYDIEMVNIYMIEERSAFREKYGSKKALESVDLFLGWGAFGSPVDKLLQALHDNTKAKIGLCIGGNAFPPEGDGKYDVLFYETEWYKPQIEGNLNIVHAFGTNTNIFNPNLEAPLIWDWLSVGAFAVWKRFHLIKKKKGTKLVIGQIQKNNWKESFDIVADLIADSVAISDMTYPTRLREIYNCSKRVYVPCDITGGGERTVLEARACGIPVEVEPDNPKLLEVLNGPLYDQHYYAAQIEKGIEGCLE